MGALDAELASGCMAYFISHQTITKQKNTVWSMTHDSKYICMQSKIYLGLDPYVHA
jgi:hypothetical protein